MLPSIDSQIEEIMYRFNWRRVADVMQHLNWIWATTKDGGVPTVGELMVVGRTLLTDVAEQLKDYEPWTYIKTGGLAARAYKTNEGVLLELGFEVADCSVHE